MISWGNGIIVFRAKLKRAPQKLRENTKQDVEQWGRNVESSSKVDAPVDLGKLQQSINYQSINGGMGAEVAVNEPYAAFVEFGVGAGVVIPEGWVELAARFKGKGLRKLSIPAQPFFLANVELQTAILRSRLRNNLKTLL